MHVSAHSAATHSHHGRHDHHVSAPAQPAGPTPPAGPIGSPPSMKIGRRVSNGRNSGCVERGLNSGSMGMVQPG